MDEYKSRVDESQREIDRPLDIGAIFDRICEAKGFRSDQALAQFLGKSPQAISQSRKTGKGDLWTLIEACAGLDLNLILRGTETAKPSPEASEGVQRALDFLLSQGYRVTLEGSKGSPQGDRP